MARALIVHAGSEFADSARSARIHIAAKGFDVHVADWDRQAWDDIRHPRGTVTVMAWYSHGGWDGPLGRPGGQASPSYEAEEWGRLKTWFAARIERGGLFVSHACHSAGSNKWEGEDPRRWVQSVAAEMMVYAVGVEGSTSSADRYHAVALLEYALVGGRAKQAARAYQPGGTQVANWRGWQRLGAQQGARASASVR
jgi:hypothetical protein